MENTESEMVKTNRYYGLRLISFICKAITILLVIIGIGMLGANIIRVLTLSPRPSNTNLFQLWVSDAIIVLLTVGGTGFLFFIISQIIDVQMAINDKLNTIATVVKSMDNIVDALEKTESPNLSTNTQHQEVMKALQRQNRMLSKMYKDIVDGGDLSDDDSIPIKLS